VPTRHRLLALTVAIAWGTNFVAIDASLRHFPPFLLVAMRFGIVAIPTVLFVPRPQVPVRWLVGYGIGFGTLQFLFLYWGMSVGFQPGIASLVLQSSAPFTVALGHLLGDRVSRRQVIGLFIASLGLALVGWERAHTAALGPFLLVLAGGFGWALGNISNARAQAPNPFRFMLWMSVVPPIPMLAIALITEGPHRIRAAFTTTGHLIPALAGLAYTVVIGTLLGSGIWTWLMARHPAGVVAPYSMLVPVVGLAASALIDSERITAITALGALLVIGGVLGGGRRRRITTPAGVDAAAVVAIPSSTSDVPPGDRR
jgi:O-acetylserine/cysteine efflux transporter